MNSWKKFKCCRNKHFAALSMLIKEIAHLQFPNNEKRMEIGCNRTKTELPHGFFLSPINVQACFVITWRLWVGEEFICLVSCSHFAKQLSKPCTLYIVFYFPWMNVLRTVMENTIQIDRWNKKASKKWFECAHEWMSSVRREIRGQKIVQMLQTDTVSCRIIFFVK